MSDLSKLLSVEQSLGHLVAPSQSREEKSLDDATSITRRKGTVVAVNNVAGTADVSVNGVTIPGIAYQTVCTLLVGDIVWVEFAGKSPQVSGQLLPSAWVNLTYLTGCTTLASWSPLAVRRLPGQMVSMRGTIQLGAASVGAVIANVPLAYRPTAYPQIIKGIYTSAGSYFAGLMVLGLDGNLTASVASNNNFFYFDGTVYPMV